MLNFITKIIYHNYLNAITSITTPLIQRFLKVTKKLYKYQLILFHVCYILHYIKKLSALKLDIKRIHSTITLNKLLFLNVIFTSSLQQKFWKVKL